MCSRRSTSPLNATPLRRARSWRSSCVFGNVRTLPVGRPEGPHQDRGPRPGHPERTARGRGGSGLTNRAPRAAESRREVSTVRARGLGRQQRWLTIPVRRRLRMVVMEAIERIEVAIRLRGVHATRAAPRAFRPSQSGQFSKRATGGAPGDVQRMRAEARRSKGESS